MTTSNIIEPDLSELTARQRRAWEAGDYPQVVSRTDMAATRPHDHADLRARWSGRTRDSRRAARC